MSCKFQSSLCMNLCCVVFEVAGTLAGDVSGQDVAVVMNPDKHVHDVE